MLSLPVLILIGFTGASFLWHHVKNIWEPLVLQDIEVSAQEPLEKGALTALLEEHNVQSVHCVKKVSAKAINYITMSTDARVWIASCSAYPLSEDVKVVQQDGVWSVQGAKNLESSKKVLLAAATLDHLKKQLEGLRTQMQAIPVDPPADPSVSRHWFVNDSGTVSVKVKVPKNGVEK